MRNVTEAAASRTLARVLVIGLIAACMPALRQASAEVQHDTNATELRLQADGTLLGQVMTYDEKLELRPAQVRVTFARGSEILSVAQTDAEGMFRAQGLAPGSYAVFTTGTDGFGAFGIRVLPAEVPVVGGVSTQDGQPVLNGETPLSFGQAPASSYQLFASLIQTDWGRGKVVGDKRASSGDLTKAETGSPSRPSPLSQVKSARARVASVADHDMTHANLRVDGNLVGRVMNLDKGDVRPETTQVLFLQGGQSVASVRTDEWGYFQVVGLRPGLYTVASLSKRGFSAFGVSVQPFEAGQPGPQQQTLLRLSSGARVLFTSSGTAAFNVVGYAPAPPEDYQRFDSEAQAMYGSPNMTVTPAAGGGAPPMGGGGGGGLGGMGMLGALGGVAAGIGSGGGGDSGTPGTPASPSSP